MPLHSEMLKTTVKVMETAQSCTENRSSVTDRTWLQLMCCTPSRPWCPNFRVWRYGDGAGVNLELTEQEGSGFLEGNLVNIQTSSIIQEVTHIYTMRRVQGCECSKTGMEVQ